MDDREGRSRESEGRKGPAEVDLPERRRRIGRPRQPATDRAILEAAIGLLSVAGPEGATVGAIAARSGVAKSTIYRRWPSREALVLDAMRMAVQVDGHHPEALRELDQALGSATRTQARNILRLVRSPLFRATLPMIARELFAETALGVGFRADVFRPMRSALRESLEARVARGEIRANVDVDLLLDLINGSIVYRALLGEPLDEQVADAIAELVERGAAPAAEAVSPA